MPMQGKIESAKAKCTNALVIASLSKFLRGYLLNCLEMTATVYSNESWADIRGFEGYYQISNYGNVKSLNYNQTGKEQILKPLKTKNGYLRVCLHNGNNKFMPIHRLVATHFIPNDDLFKTDINHIDENKENNNVNNLEWCDKQYNNDYSLSKPVNQYDLQGNLIKTWKSTSEIEKCLGFERSLISKCCLGKSHYKTAHGFIWKYVE